MALTAQDLQKAATDTTDAGFDILTEDITSPTAGAAAITKIYVGASGTATMMDASNPIFVSGTVTANLSATDNAVLDAIAASVAGTVTVDGSGVTQPVSGTVTANLGAVDNAVLDAIAASVAGTLVVDGSGVTQPVSGTVTANLSATDNAVLDAIAASVSGTLVVDGSGVTQPVSGTITANLSATDNAVLDDIATQATTLANSIAASRMLVGGGAAHDSMATGNPVTIGGRATDSIEGLTQVAATDNTYITTDLNGVVVTRSQTTLEEIVSYSVSNTAGTELTVTGLDAGGAGIHNYITAVTVHNSHASTNGFIQLLDGSGGTPLWTFPNPAGGGTTMRFDPPLKQPTANTALFWDGSAAITTVYISIAGFQAQG